MSSTTSSDRIFAPYEFGLNPVWSSQTWSYSVKGFDLEKVKSDLESLFVAEGIDINDVLEDASRHFQASSIVPLNESISDDQLEELAIDELGACD
ncbi:hypothetical protein SH668x_001031 [Planctomicrobium sp. SH668]|uniref:hypothetical protein n=1 Tax=Planctomicrobium sp. SH668 TaxID=3448126 RepID=UPI003F5C11CC